MNWKNRLMAVAVVLAGVGMVSAPMDVEAKRLGGGRASGMQRQMPSRQPSVAPNPSPNPGQQAAAPAPATPTQPMAQPGRRSWLGPIAGIAAGLGIAALMSHFGMGEAFSHFMTLALLAMVAVFVISWVMRRFSGGGAASQGTQLAGAGAPYQPQPYQPQPPMQREAQQAALAPASGGAPAGDLAQVPAGFDMAGFTRTAKMIFIRMQAANDAGNVEDLRKFTTPELFASLRLDLQERGAAPNQTDVMQLDAEVVDTAREDGQWIVSVRFHGLVREEVNAGALPFNELWHLVKPQDESRDWAIAGITPIEN
ncbi:MAG: TIM44-like domain-containing protein [Aquabacterium sp.]